MYYYTVPVIGDGSEDNPFRPDLPEGTSFVGNIGSDGEYLVASPVDLADTTKRKKQLPRQALEATANAKGLKYDDVLMWFAGGAQ